MPDAFSPVTNAASTLGPLRIAWFDGILTAPRPAPEDLRAAVAAIERLGLGPPDVRVEGNRFSLLMEDRLLGPADLTESTREGLSEALQRLFERLPERGDIESTLRCTEVFERETRETLFTSEDRHLRLLSRTRPPTDLDLARVPPPSRLLERVRLTRKRAIGLLVLGVIGLALAAYANGWLDRVFATDPSALARDYGGFDELLEVELWSDLGTYHVEVRRGPRYPSSTEELRRLLEGASTTLGRAVVDVVAGGDEIHFLVLDADGPVLSSVPISLRPLLGGATATASLRGHPRADRVALSLDDTTVVH